MFKNPKLIVVLFVIVSLSAIGRATGQNDSGTESVFVPAPRDVTRLVSKAEKAISEKDYTRAIALLGSLLSEENTEDYLTIVPDSGGVARSFRARALKLLGDMPESEMKTYQLRYGVPAQRILDEAIAESDYGKMALVIRRFFYTEAGFTASMLLGYHHLGEGRPVAGAFAFSRIVDCARARRQFDPEASILLATCWSLAESESKAIDALKSLRDRNRKVNFRFMNQVVQLPQRDEELGPWLTDLIGSSPLSSNTLIGEWVMFRGNAQRNAYSGSGFPLLSPRWEVPVHNDLNMEKAVQKQQREFVYSGDAIVPSVQPIAVGDTIVMRTFDKLIGIDFKTGKRQWIFPSFDANLLDTGDVLVNERLNLETREGPIRERMWMDTVFGQVSSDGKRIFVIPHPGFADHVNSRVVVINAARQRSNPLASRRFNELKAVDVEEEGAFLWEVGGETGMDEPKLAGAFFLGPPLPVNGLLYVVCQQQDDVKVVALQPETGQLAWAQQLATTATGIRPTSVSRRLAGASPSFSDGILVCPTGIGAVVAIELSTRSLLWGYQYANPIVGTSRISPQIRTVPVANRIGGLWRDSTITIADGRVVFTPVDKQQLICVDLFSGAPIWKTQNGRPLATAPRKDSIYVGCIDSGKIMLVGVQHTRAIDLETGKEVWEADTKPYGAPSGRGYANRGSYFYPTTEERIIQVDIKDGSVIANVPSNGILGNLICYQGEVISHGVNKVATYPQDEPSTKYVELAKQSDTMTSDLWALDAQLQIHKRNYRPAMASIEKAYDADPKAAHRDVLVKLMTEMVRSDFDYGIKLAEKYGDLLTEDSRLEFSAAKINGLIQRDKNEEAIDSIFELLTPLDSFVSSQQDRFISNISSQERVRIDRWISLKLQQAAGDSDDLGAKIRKQLAVLITNSQLPANETFDALAEMSPFGLLGFEASINEHVLELSKQLRTDGSRLRSARALAFLANSSDKQVAADALAQLVTLYSECNFFSGAAKYLKRLEAEFPEQTLTGGETSKEFVKRMSEQATAQTSVAWKNGKAKITASPFYPKKDSQNYERSARHLVTLFDPNDVVAGSYSLWAYGTIAEFELRDADGRVINRWPSRGDSFSGDPLEGRAQAELRDGLLKIQAGGEFFVYDWLSLLSGEPSCLWFGGKIHGRTQFVQPSRINNLFGISLYPNRSNGRSAEVAAPCFDGVCYLEDSTLVCADAMTGEKIWCRNEVQPHAKVYGDDQCVVLFDAPKRKIYVYDIRSGNEIRRVELERELGTVWANPGRFFFLSMMKDGKPTMALLDPLSGEMVWQRNFEPSTKACLKDNKHVLVHTPDSNLMLLDLLSGEAVFETKIEVSRVSAMDMLPCQDDYLVIFHTGRSSSGRIQVPEMGTHILKSNYSAPLYHGYFVRVDKETGEPVWQRPAFIEDFQICTSQPKNSPVLCLTRRIDETETQRAFMQYSFLDLRDGKHLGETRLQSHYVQAARIVSESNSVRVFSRDQEIRIDITDEFQPPRPVAHLVNRVTAQIAPLEDRTRKLSESSKLDEREKILQALREKAEEQRKLAEELNKKFEEQKKVEPKVDDK